MTNESPGTARGLGALRSLGAWLRTRQMRAILPLVVVPVLAIVKIVANRGLWQPDGLRVGWDFAAFLTGARIMASPEAGRLYDLALQRQVALQFFPGTYTPFPFISPPFFAVALVPFVGLPYAASLGLWTGAGLTLCLLSLRWLGVTTPGRILPFLMTSLPFYFTLLSGQPTLFTFAILAFIYWSGIQKRAFARAGVASGLLLYKPHSILGVLLYFAVKTRGRAALRFWCAFAGTAALVVGIGAIASPRASREYVSFALTVLPKIVEIANFDWGHFHTWRAFWALVFRGSTAVGEALATVTVLFGVFGCLRLWRLNRLRAEESSPGLQGASAALDYAAAVALGAWCAPHASIYDWMVLGVPALLLWVNFPSQRDPLLAIFALLWLATFTSEAIALAAEGALPFSFQLDLPVLGVLCWMTYRAVAPVLEPVAEAA